MSHPIGIDIGKTTLALALADNDNPKKFTTHTVTLDHNGWRAELLFYIPPEATIALEPTGWHYSAPILRLLNEHTPDLWIVNNNLTAGIREMHINKAKTDKFDSQALAYIAQKIANGEAIRGAKQYRHDRITPANLLRAIVNERRRTIKTSTRALNQIDQLLHNIDPILSHQKERWLLCAQFGYLTPAEILSANWKTLIPDGRVRRPYTTLKKSLHPTPVSEAHRDILQRIFTGYQSAQEYLADLEAQITSAIDAEPFKTVTENWRTLPSISDNLIGALHVACNGQADLMSKAEFQSSIGWLPRTNKSGSSIQKASKSRNGYRPALDGIYIYTLFLVSDKAKPNPIRDYYQTSKTRHPGASSRRKLCGILSTIATKGKQCNWKEIYNYDE